MSEVFLWNRYRAKERKIFAGHGGTTSFRGNFGKGDQATVYGISGSSMFDLFFGSWKPKDIQKNTHKADFFLFFGFATLIAGFLEEFVEDLNFRPAQRDKKFHGLRFRLQTNLGSCSLPSHRRIAWPGEVVGGLTLPWASWSP